MFRGNRKTPRPGKLAQNLCDCLFSLFYNFCLLILALFSLPKLLWHWWAKAKYRESLSARLGFSLPVFSPKKGQQVIWMHSISMGETRAIIPLFRKIRQKYPEAAVVISTTTETGQQEAKRSMPEADCHFYLPLDFSWVVRKIVKQIQPTVLILCESDFWYHLLKFAKNRRARVALVNGKVSERSCKRFQKIPFFTRRLFANFDVLCLQSEVHRTRFLSLQISPDKMHVTGNLKFDASVQNMSIADLRAFKESLKIRESDRVLVIGSTHAPEEDWLLSAITSIWKEIPHLKVLLVPRHPERFNEVAQLIQERGFPFCRFSEQKNEEERLVLIDVMGKLNQCYQIADVAIVCGSFASHVGGHNIFEPVLFGVPVLFGPHMHSQPDLRDLVLSANAGQQVKIDEVPQVVIKILKNPEIRQKYIAACHSLATSVQGSTNKTLHFLFESHS